MKRPRCKKCATLRAQLKDQERQLQGLNEAFALQRSLKLLDVLAAIKKLTPAAAATARGLPR